MFHRRGDRIGSFQRAWKTACAKAGVPGMILHDLRRTAVRNMVRAGVPCIVAVGNHRISFRGEESTVVLVEVVTRGQPCLR